MDALATGTLLGGIGLFLLGMNLMTDSLSALGGDTIRSVVKRLIRRRSSSLATGVVVTALLQSSSATTLITVGFVSAGLVTFSESLGLILGANIGTTSTGWIVSLIGLKFKINTVALPLVGVGALMKLTLKGARARLGLALSGFGLIFVGIDVIQQGMAGLELNLTWGDELPGTLRIVVLVVIGAVMTVVMQSSSAAVATTLVALDAGSITLAQAGALVIGQNVGTTVKAILAAMGGSLSARRTAMAHTLFNLLTAVVALLLLQPFLFVVTNYAGRWSDGSPESVIAAFHTAFNMLGVLLVYPWLSTFARMVERLVPQPKRTVVADLPISAWAVPAAAIETARRATRLALRETLHVALAALRIDPPSDDPKPEDSSIFVRALVLARHPKQLLGTSDDTDAKEIAEHFASAQQLFSEVGEFLMAAKTAPNTEGMREERVQLLRAIDNARRLLELTQKSEPRATLEKDVHLQAFAQPIVTALAPLLESLDDPQELASALERAQECHRQALDDREVHRVVAMGHLVDGEQSLEQTQQALETARWIGSVPRHIARALWYASWQPGQSHAPEIADDGLS